MNRVWEAARKALQLGGDHESVLRNFRNSFPEDIISLPSVFLAREHKSVHDLIAFAAGNEFAVIEGVKTNDFVSVVALGQTADRATLGGSGFLVSPDIVVTAKHCINPDGLVGGAWLQDSNGLKLLPPISSFVTHDGSGSTSFANDIGLLRLSHPATGVSIFRIADTATINQAKAMRIVGFGEDETGSFGVKRTAMVHIRLNPSDGTIGFKDLEFVIGDPAVKDGDACQHDSGGAVILGEGGEYLFCGLISRPLNVEEPVCGDGTICLRLDRYAVWIDAQIKALGGQPRPV